MKKTYQEIVSPIYRNIWETEIENYRREFNENWIIEFDNFITQESLIELREESDNLYSERYQSKWVYNIFVDSDEKVISKSLRNKKFVTEKWCICYDEIDKESILKILIKMRVLKICCLKLYE